MESRTDQRTFFSKQPLKAFFSLFFASITLIVFCFCSILRENEIMALILFLSFCKSIVWRRCRLIFCNSAFCSNIDTQQSEQIPLHKHPHPRRNWSAHTRRSVPLTNLSTKAPSLFLIVSLRPLPFDGSTSLFQSSTSS